MVGSYPISKLRLMGLSQMLWKLNYEDYLSWKTTSYGRRPQKLKIGISQQPLILKLGLRGQSHILWKIKMKMTSHERRPHK